MYAKAGDNLDIQNIEKRSVPMKNRGKVYGETCVKIIDLELEFSSITDKLDKIYETYAD